MQQAALFSATSRLQAEFDRFDRENPDVWRLFKHFTQKAIRAGHKHYSADAILHRIRWHTSVETKTSDFKLNNNFTAYYARKWASLFPEHEGFFRMRRVKEGWAA